MRLGAYATCITSKPRTAHWSGPAVCSSGLAVAEMAKVVVRRHVFLELGRTAFGFSDRRTIDQNMVVAGLGRLGTRERDTPAG